MLEDVIFPVYYYLNYLINLNLTTYHLYAVGIVPVKCGYEPKRDFSGLRDQFFAIDIMSVMTLSTKW